MKVKLNKKEFVRLWLIIPCVCEKFDVEEIQVISDIDPSSLKSALNKISEEVIRRPFAATSGRGAEIVLDLSEGEIFALRCTISNYEHDDLVNSDLDKTWEDLYEKFVV
jgi:molecular chaperone DnaK (HSP70)